MFLADERVQVRNLAMESLCGLLATPLSRTDFLGKASISQLHAISALANSNNALTANHAYSTLVNLAATGLAAFPGFATKETIATIVANICSSKNVNADLACMLLNNLAKSPAVIQMIAVDTQLLDQLMHVFMLPTNTFNPSADFAFLAGIFANISTTSEGSAYVCGKLDSLIVMTEHPHLIRRGGVISAIKNVIYSSSHSIHLNLLRPDLNLLVHLLLPLCGPDDFDDDDLEGMPVELQFLGTEKRRETDPKLRIMLCETLLLLCGTIESRAVLRDNNVYCVVKKLHLDETDEDVQEVIEKLVNMLMRDEEEENANDKENVLTKDAFPEKASTN